MAKLLTANMKTASPEDVKRFRDRLYVTMTDRGFSQSDLARAAFGVDPKTGTVKDRDKIGIWLRGKGLPGSEKLEALARALNVSVDFLRIIPRRPGE